MATRTIRTIGDDVLTKVLDWNARCATPGDTLTPGQSCRVAEIHSTLLIVEPVLTETARRAAH